MYSQGVEDENYLRGVQEAGADGKVTVTSIFPACSSGRWPHLHVEVSRRRRRGRRRPAARHLPVGAAGGRLRECYATDGYSSRVRNLSQVSLTADTVFSDDEGESQLAAMSGSVPAGYTAALAVGA